MNKGKQRQVHIRLPESLKNEVNRAAENDNRSMSGWIVCAVKEKLLRDKNETKTGG